jgi:hypothetical protein
MGKTSRKAILPVGAVGILALLIAWVLTHFGAGMGGSGSLAPQNSPQQPAAPVQAQPAGSMQVIVSGDRYLVDGNEMTLDQVMAKARSASAVRITSGPDSRMGATMALERAMETAHLSYTMETLPAQGQ